MNLLQDVIFNNYFIDKQNVLCYLMISISFGLFNLVIILWNVNR
jgi:hypothetical protein